MTSPRFELPPEIRSLMEESIEASRRAFETYFNAMERALGAAGGSTATAHSAARDLFKVAGKFAQENAEASFAFIERLMRAKSADEVVRLQGEFAKTQGRRIAEQAETLGEAALGVMSKRG